MKRLSKYKNPTESKLSIPMAQTLVLDDYDQETLDPNNKLSPIYRRPGSLTGYTGYYSHGGTETHELEQSCEKYMIRGYTGNILKLQKCFLFVFITGVSS